MRYQDWRKSYWHHYRPPGETVLIEGTQPVPLILVGSTTPLINSTQVIREEEMEPNEATVVVGSNLRVRSANSAWRELGLAGMETVTGKRIDDVFVAADIRGSILDVLAPGDSLRGVVIPVGREGAERYFCAT